MTRKSFWQRLTESDALRHERAVREAAVRVINLRRVVKETEKTRSEYLAVTYYSTPIMFVSEGEAARKLQEVRDNYIATHIDNPTITLL